MAPAFPISKFGFSSNCIICWDQALDAFVEDYIFLWMLISLISFIFGLRARRSGIIDVAVGAIALSIPFVFYYLITYRDQVNWIYYLDRVRQEANPVTGSIKDVAVRVREHGRFIVESAFKGWAFFAAVPFVTGLLMQALFKIRTK